MLLTDWTLPINVEDVLRGQGADPEVVRARRPALVTAAQKALQEGLSLVKPAAAVEEIEVREWKHARIHIAGDRFVSGVLAAGHLAGAQRIAAVVCTVGPELESRASQLMTEEPLLALALDGLANAAVDLLAEQVCGWLAAQAQGEGLQTSTPLSPGAEGWPVGIGQPEIFALVDADRIGVRLTESSLMLPRKSVSFVVGIGTEMGQTHPCDLCSLKETCRYRLP